MRLRHFTFLWNFWPPFIGLGIRIHKLAADYKKVRMELKKRPWNANFFGTQYGGGIFAMTDGIYVLMLLYNLPKKYIIWDKAASIEYLKKGHTHLHADFVITDAELKKIEKDVAEKKSLDWSKSVDIKDSSGEVVARVVRTLSIKIKKHIR